MGFDQYAESIFAGSQSTGAICLSTRADRTQGRMNDQWGGPQCFAAWILAAVESRPGSRLGKQMNHAIKLARSTLCI